MHPQSDQLRQEGAGEPRLHQLPIRSPQGTLVQTLAHHPARKLKVLQLEIGRPVGIRMDQCLSRVVEGTKESTAGIEQRIADLLEPLTPDTAPVDTQLALECHLKVAAPVGHGEPLGRLHARL